MNCFQDSKSNSNIFWLLLAGSVLSFFSVSFYLSAIRHLSFGSSAWDLGIFSQAVWQISEGMPPVSSFLGVHILADHASFFLFLIAIPFRIWQSPITILLLQSLLISFGLIPLSLLAKRRSLSNLQIFACQAAYCLYPFILNISLFDFHPDALAMAFFLSMILAVEINNLLLYVISILIILSTKAVLSLSVLFYGLALLCSGKERAGYGLIAGLMGFFWYIFATKFVIPSFGIAEFSVQRHGGHFGELGSSPLHVIYSSIKSPQIPLRRIFSARSADFMGKIFYPVMYIFLSINKKWVFYAVACLPTFAICMLSTSGAFVSDSRQYMLPIVPFVMLAVVDFYDACNKKYSIAFRKAILFAAVMISVIYFFKFTDAFRVARDFRSVDLNRISSLRGAISRIDKGSSVITSDKISSHLASRNFISMFDAASDREIIDYDYVLIDNVDPGWKNTVEANAIMLQKLESSDSCVLISLDKFHSLYECKSQL